MPNKKTEMSPSGTPIYRHEASDKPFQAAFASPDSEKIQQHVEKHIGKIETVYHELVSNLIHVDVLFVKPNAVRNFITLVTSGMSDRPMQSPESAPRSKYAELMICLPPEWPLSDEALKDENNYWPIRLLKMLARLPHQYDTWLWYAHTVPNGDPPTSFSKNTKLSGAMIVPPLSAPADFSTLKIDENKTVFFFGVLPLYTEEMNFKLKNGSDALFERLDKSGVRGILNIQRPNACKSSRWPF